MFSRFIILFPMKWKLQRVKKNQVKTFLIISPFIKERVYNYVFIVGDMNTCFLFGQHLVPFCRDKNLILSTKDNLPVGRARNILAWSLYTHCWCTWRCNWSGDLVSLGKNWSHYVELNCENGSERVNYGNSIKGSWFEQHPNLSCHTEELHYVPPQCLSNNWVRARSTL